MNGFVLGLGFYAFSCVCIDRAQLLDGCMKEMNIHLRLKPIVEVNKKTEGVAKCLASGNHGSTSI